MGGVGGRSHAAVTAASPTITPGTTSPVNNRAEATAARATLSGRRTGAAGTAES
jgi:hypothetical protein